MKHTIKISLLLFIFSCSPQATYGNTGMIDSITEYFETIKRLQNFSPVVNPESAQDIISAVREKFKVPSHINIISPFGGREVILFVFHSRGIYIAERHDVFAFDKYKHLHSVHNLKNVYLLFDNEPVKIDAETYAVERRGKNLVVSYITAGITGSVDVSSGMSFMLKDSKNIIIPLSMKTAFKEKGDKGKAENK
ncbi:MAG: hypothetical protein DDT19_00028 [Syntrophomonadaceae bacterium]|nr:hypothetical protein [Bacillota bacterium]